MTTVLPSNPCDTMFLQFKYKYIFRQFSNQFYVNLQPTFSQLPPVSPLTRVFGVFMRRRWNVFSVVQDTFEHTSEAYLESPQVKGTRPFFKSHRVCFKDNGLPGSWTSQNLSFGNTIHRKATTTCKCLIPWSLLNPSCNMC